MALTNPFQDRQLKEYGKDGIQYINASQCLKKYIDRHYPFEKTSFGTVEQCELVTDAEKKIL